MEAQLKQIENRLFQNYLNSQISTESFLRQIVLNTQSQKDLERKTRVEQRKEERALKELSYQIKNKCSGPSLGRGNPYSEVVFVLKHITQKRVMCLRDMLAKIGQKKQNFYITGLFKDKPPQKEENVKKELKKSGFYLYKEIDIIRPRIIVTLGKDPTQFILKKDYEKIHGELHNIIINNNPVIVFPTFDPQDVVTKTGAELILEDFEYLNKLI